MPKPFEEDESLPRGGIHLFETSIHLFEASVHLFETSIDPLELPGGLLPKVRDLDSRLGESSGGLLPEIGDLPEGLSEVSFEIGDQLLVHSPGSPGLRRVNTRQPTTESGTDCKRGHGLAVLFPFLLRLISCSLTAAMTM